MFLPDMRLEDVLETIPPDSDRPRYNIAPTQSIGCITHPEPAQSSPKSAQRQLLFARWGLVPSWSDDPSIGSRMINARSETVDSKPSFKRAFAKRRCLIPADGYYEWMKTADGKQPYLIHQSDHSPFALAGLWEQNKKVTIDGRPIITCTILTTSANNTTAAIHDRMPVFLNAASYDEWLDPHQSDLESLKSLLLPASETLLQTTPVSRHVNNVKNDDPKCTEPYKSQAAKPRSLFD